MMRLTLVILFSLTSLAFAQSPAPSSGTGIEGVVSLGPTHGGPVREDMPSSAPVANTVLVATDEKGKATEFTTDDAGRFRVSLPPGHYSVAFKERKIGIGRRGPFPVDVAADKMTTVDWHCDTGMR